jgi:hypothetical protein
MAEAYPEWFDRVIREATQSEATQSEASDIEGARREQDKKKTKSLEARFRIQVWHNGLQEEYLS